MVSNTIIVNNTALSAGGIYSQTSGAVFDYNDVQGNAPDDYVGLSAGPNDLATEPLFRDAATYDLRLQQISPLVDKVLPGVVTGDYGGDPRPVPVNGMSDIGADEFLLARMALTPNRYGSDVPGQTITYTHMLTNLGNYTDTIALTAQGNHGWSIAVTPVTSLP